MSADPSPSQPPPPGPSGPPKTTKTIRFAGINLSAAQQAAAVSSPPMVRPAMFARPAPAVSAVTPPMAPTVETFAELHGHFREFKHATNNALAVILALGEMTQRNPDHAKRLTEGVADKCPQVVAQLRELDEKFRALTGGGAG